MARKDTQQDQKSAASASVEVEKVKAEANAAAARAEAAEEEKKRYFDALQKQEEKRDADNKELHKELRQMREENDGMRRTFIHEIRGLQQYAQNQQDLYHTCYTALMLQAQQMRIMRARLKRQAEAAGESFDADEFPLVNIELYDPKQLPRYTPTKGWDQLTASDDKKITGRITLTPDKEP